LRNADLKRNLNPLLFAGALAIVSCSVLAEEKETPPPGMGKYVVVLWNAGTPVPGEPEKRMKDAPEPDLEKGGGRVLARVANRRIVYLPFGVAKQLQRHEAVAYVQRIWLGESLAGWDERGPSVTSPKITADADTNLEWGPKAFSYDGSGNITRVGTDEYTYDSAGRLIRAKVNGKTQKFKYDAFGNLVRQEVEGAAPIDIPVDPSSNRLEGPEYDAAGNVTTRDGHARYVYDSLNMLTHYEGASDRRILYDADDERVGTLIDSLSRWTIRDLDGQSLREYRGEDFGLTMPWYWEQDHICGEGLLLGGETQEWRYQGSTSPMVFGGERHYHLDHLGSVRLVTNKLGRSISEHDFYPFGVAQTKTYQEPVNWADPHVDGMRFAGHWRDFLGYTDVEGTDYLDYLHARYYDPNVGRFLSVDPVMGAAGRPQSWNRYSYVQNDPMGSVDPTGMVEAALPVTLTGEIDVTAAAYVFDAIWATFQNGMSEINNKSIALEYRLFKGPDLERANSFRNGSGQQPFGSWKSVTSRTSAGGSMTFRCLWAATCARQRSTGLPTCSVQLGIQHSSRH
jgi:RHS repeat-associated protein